MLRRVDETTAQAPAYGLFAPFDVASRTLRQPVSVATPRPGHTPVLRQGGPHRIAAPPWFLALPACRLSGRHSLDRSRPPGCPPLVRHGEHPALVLRHVAGGHVLQAGPEFLDLAAKRHAGGGGLDEGGPPVAGVGPAADEAGSFQALDHPGHRGRVGIESRGEVGLRDPQLPCSTHIRSHRAATEPGDHDPPRGPGEGRPTGRCLPFPADSLPSSLDAAGQTHPLRRHLGKMREYH